MPPTASSDVPRNWTWADDGVAPGPVVLVDVDGVIADGWHRQRYLRDGRNDWKGFFAAADKDTPIEGAVELLRVMGADLSVVLLTARPHTLHETTLAWLALYSFRWDLLIMRDRSDGGLSSPDFKRRSVHELADRGYAPQLALDDDERNVAMFRSEGVPTMYVHSGYYEA